MINNLDDIDDDFFINCYNECSNYIELGKVLEYNRKKTQMINNLKNKIKSLGLEDYNTINNSLAYKLSDEDFIKLFNSSKSLKDFSNKLGYTNTTNIVRKRINELNLDINIFKKNYKNIYSPIVNPKNEDFMNTKALGNIGEAKILSKFVEYNIPIYIPFGDNEKADFVIEINKKLFKIQVKTSTRTNNGTTSFRLQVFNSKNGERFFEDYSIEEVDYFALYDFKRDKIYLLKNEDNRKSITIRHKKPLIPNKNINYEEDYLFENTITSIA